MPTELLEAARPSQSGKIIEQQPGNVVLATLCWQRRDLDPITL